MTITELKQTAVEVRKGIVTATHAAKSGHPGGSLSATEIFTYLYFEEMNIDPKNPKMEDRTFCLIERTYGTGTLCGTGNPGIFSGERFRDTAPYRFLFAGTSGYETYSGCGYVIRFFRTGDFLCSWNGTCRKNGSQRLPCLYAVR